MPLLLSQSELRPLAEDDSALDGAIDAVEASLMNSHRGDPGSAIFAGLELSNDDEIGTCFVASGAGPASIRIFPSRFDGARRNSWLGLCLDGKSGEVVSLIALDDLNVLRTSVPAALGVKYLAPAQAKTLTVLGSGAQARSHARTFARVMPDLQSIKVWSPTQAHREAFAAELARSSGVATSAVAAIEEAVSEADVITATGRYQHGQPAVPDPSLVRAGALFVSMTASGLNLLGHGARIAIPTLQRPELVAHGFSSGLLRNAPPPFPPNVLELARVIDGTEPARSSAAQTVVFELAAPYLWDLPIFGWITRWAAERGLGQPYDFSDVR
jgi:ornithine cyclodeaminase/alanine dehydrogenase-like protein (mu-crystallin family)